MRQRNAKKKHKFLTRTEFCNYIKYDDDTNVWWADEIPNFKGKILIKVRNPYNAVSRLYNNYVKIVAGMRIDKVIR